MPNERGDWAEVLEALQTASKVRAEQRAALVERLKKSVLPLHTPNERGRPMALASCVLARVGSNFYAFTAGHVLQSEERIWLWTAAAGQLVLLPSQVGYERDSNGLDLGIIPLRRRDLGPFDHCIFLSGADIAEGDQSANIFEAFNLVVGYPASRSQAKVSYDERKIHHVLFNLSTSQPPAEAYAREGLAQDEHLLVEFDHDGADKSMVPPKLQGLSGGGIFHFSRTTYQGPLVAIATEHRRVPRLIVSTRLKHFTQFAREINGIAPSETFD